MKKLYRNITTAGLIGAGAFSLGACASPEYNYEGSGNEYIVTGPVADVEDDGTIHINDKRIQVVSAAGRAATWFANGDGHNFNSENFNFEPYYNIREEGFWSVCEEKKTVGHVYDLSGNEIEPTELLPGNTIEVKGAIRDSRNSVGGKYRRCSSEEFSVYETVKVIAE